MLPFGWERLPAERILSGTAKREFPSELLRYSLDDIERFLRTGKSGIATSKLQKAKKLLEQAKRLAEKCGGKSGKRY
jgi:phosphatidylinositol kinase/protein kinase (PI-3  family)